MPTVSHRAIQKDASVILNKPGEDFLLHNRKMSTRITRAMRFTTTHFLPLTGRSIHSLHNLSIKNSWAYEILTNCKFGGSQANFVEEDHRTFRSVSLSLGVQLIEHPWERNRFTNVFEAANPRDSSFDSHPESCVWNGPETAEIQIPTERFFR